MKYKLAVQTSPYVMLSSDYSQQEPRLTAAVSQDKKMIQSFIDGHDIYSTIASMAFNVSYEECLEFHPETHEYQKEGKERRTEAKSIVLGILYGRSTKTIGEQLYGHDDSLIEEERTKKAQKVYDSVLSAFPSLRSLMVNAQKQARTVGYVETILGRRRHIPDMMLPEFEFEPMSKYVNPDIDPMNPDTLKDQNKIPQRITDQLLKELKSYKYFGQVVKRTKELKEQKIRVINNRPRITDASRQCVNCVDDKTEILTTHGWKKYNQIALGEEIFGYVVNEDKLIRDTINEIHISEGYFEMTVFSNQYINAVSTDNHRWVRYKEFSTEDNFLTTKDIKSYYNGESTSNKNLSIRIMGGSKIDVSDDPVLLTDTEFRIIGLAELFSLDIKKNELILDSSRIPREKLNLLLDSPISNVSSLQDVNTDTFLKGITHSIDYSTGYITLTLTEKLNSLYFKGKVSSMLTHEFISRLSGYQAVILFDTMQRFNPLTRDYKDRLEHKIKEEDIYVCSDMEEVGLIQHLLLMCGLASSIEWTTTVYTDDITFPVVVIQYKNFTHVSGLHISKTYKNTVWCVTTSSGTWIARRNGTVYITGNSIVQGSAADLTKMAILNLCNNEEWQRMGGRLLTPIHDELLCEVPMENWEKGGELLADCMCEAADFMPFGIKCDVETTLRWYGNEFPCKYPKPESYPTNNEEEIKWVQWHLLEMEYILPVIKDENGDTPRGDGARGISGVITDEYEQYVFDYITHYNIPIDDFVSHIENKVVLGIA